MKWYWIALLTGLIAPWILMGKDIAAGFLSKENPIQKGFGVWSGMAIVTVPVMFLVIGGVHWLFG